MSPDELKARRAALQALEDARAEARTRLTERQRRWRWRRASGIVTASITPSWPRWRHRSSTAG